MQLDVESLSHRYGPTQALTRIHLRVKPGQFHALLGRNGAGKTTLFGLLTRLLHIQSGDIRFDGISLTHHAAEVMKKLGVVFQQNALDLDLSVDQNLHYHAALHGLSRGVARARIDSELARFDLSSHQHRLVRTLNAGHRRRIELARALIHKPSFLLLDEPTAGLDAESRHLLVRHVHELCSEQAITVLWATHLFDEIHPDDNVFILDNGQLLKEGPARTLIPAYKEQVLGLIPKHGGTTV
ncbi:ATP-binding cassette domain-containing protein [Marinobacter litoralis]|uniref:ATP-binding cassette domain-containing protein n=1 Tax=Marinobacter litoralis TaxID=187981 RepID=UPI0018EB7EB9|nr:ATP-binding cassette domain-containing protein [Marinobacter litoralis]MBJ6136800.1 ATP-binding cassette domain-containing protein [Marinobacter litoralis]